MLRTGDKDDASSKEKGARQLIAPTENPVCRKLWTRNVVNYFVRGLKKGNTKGTLAQKLSGKKGQWTKKWKSEI